MFWTLSKTQAIYLYFIHASFSTLLVVCAQPTNVGLCHIFVMAMLDQPFSQIQTFSQTDSLRLALFLTPPNGIVLVTECASWLLLL